MRRKVLRETVCVVDPKRGPIAHAVLVYNEHYLPLESMYCLDIELRRRRGVKMGQVMLLDAEGTKAMFEIIKKLWKRIQELGLQEVFIAIDPDDVPKYERLKFEKIDWPMRYWDFADYAPVAVMVLNVENGKRDADNRLLEHFF